ncbi:MAG: hypothetical protein K6E15_12725 [Prevotella sp.]|nr:hypothetical protein [Prevotella sp.]
MEQIFNEQMLKDYFQEIVEKSKEAQLLKANIAGLLMKSSELIESKLRHRFDGKCIVTLTKQVLWRVTKVTVDLWGSIERFSVKITFVGCPQSIVDKHQLTDKERELVSKLQAHWDKQDYYLLSADFYKLANELSTLKHNYRCVESKTFDFGLDDMMVDRDFDYIHFKIGDFAEGGKDYSTSDLKSIADMI